MEEAVKERTDGEPAKRRSGEGERPSGINITRVSVHAAFSSKARELTRGDERTRRRLPPSNVFSFFFPYLSLRGNCVSASATWRADLSADPPTRSGFGAAWETLSWRRDACSGALRGANSRIRARRHADPPHSARFNVIDPGFDPRGGNHGPRLHTGSVHLRVLEESAVPRLRAAVEQGLLQVRQ